MTELLVHLQALVRATNTYMNAPASSGKPRTLLLQSVARYVAVTLQMLGCTWDGEYGGGGDAASGASREQVLAPLLDVVTSFR